SSPVLTLQGAEPERNFSPTLRKDLTRARKKARELGAISLRMTSPAPSELDPLFESALAIEADSWKGREGSALARAPELGAFYRRYAERASRPGLLRIAFLDIAGVPAAMQVAVECGGAYWLLKIGYREMFARCSPGALLLAETISWAAQRGLERYEFLGGSEA